MKYFILLIQSEFKHFSRSPFKITSLLLFVAAAIYGLQNGYNLFRKHHAEIIAIKAKNVETVKKVSGWFDAGKTGPEDRPWINVSSPFWAIWNAPATATKEPSPLMPFTIGQTEQFGYYKPVTNWSSTFDSDLAEEIANPERLSAGTLDFGFAVLYLLPVLLIVLLFNVVGLEKDLGFYRLIQVNAVSKKTWLIARFTFYFLSIIVVLFGLMIPYAFLTNTFQNNSAAFLSFFFHIVLYALIWFVFFYFINVSGNGSPNHALKMIAVWISLCIVIPGGVHQIASLKYPANYMTDYINASRDETYKLWELPSDSVRQRLLVLYPKLADTRHGKDSISDRDIVDNSSSGLVNDLMKNTALTIESHNEDKNQFIRKSYLINPVCFFQNKLNALANNDYYAYQRFREIIQSKIDKKVNAILFDCWNKEIVTKEKYLHYVELFKRDYE
jgi:ABC-2 type transport system permease protein